MLKKYSDDGDGGVEDVERGPGVKVAADGSACACAWRWLLLQFLLLCHWNGRHIADIVGLLFKIVSDLHSYVVFFALFTGIGVT